MFKRFKRFKGFKWFKRFKRFKGFKRFKMFKRFKGFNSVQSVVEKEIQRIGQCEPYTSKSPMRATPSSPAFVTVTLT